MKRLGSSESLGDLMSICPSTTDDLNPTTFHHQVYTKRDFQSIFEDDVDDHHLTTTGGDVDSAHSKKRRLSVDQVKALEKNFEVENKLEPERKVKLAQELGLQPRQVAVWFQNRRARWKTKNLERDYGVLKASYDSLKANFEALQQDNQALVKEIKEMKSKLNGDEEVNKAVSDDKNVSSVKDDEVEEETALVCESNGLQQQLIIEQTPTVLLTSQQDLIGSSARLGMEFIKDGPSDSDSSAILNEVTSPNAATQPPFSPPGGGVAIHLLNHHQEQSLLLGSFSSPTSASPVFRFNCLASSPSPPPPPPSSTITTYFHNLSSESSTSGAWSQSQHHNVHQLAFVKMEEEEELEEHDFFSDEACNFFSEDQAPSLHHLYCGTDGGSD